MPLHAEITVGDVHIPYNWTYVNNAARLAATGLATGDLGKFCRVLSDNSIWMLIATTPTWVPINPEAFGTNLDGYASDATVSAHYITFSAAIQSVLKELDGYDDRIDEIKGGLTSFVEDVGKELDGYDGRIEELKSGIELIIEDVGKALDGYDGQIQEIKGGFATFEENVTKDLDGYDGRIEELKTGIELIIEDVGKALDGYDGQIQEVKANITTFVQDIRSACDGYGSLEKTTENTAAIAALAQDVRSACDGYGSLEKTTENTAAIAALAQDVRSACDGYGSLEKTTENTAAIAALAQDVRSACDGYGSLEKTTENTAAIAALAQDTRSACDGYADLAIENQRWIDASTQLADLRTAADGYALDGYVTLGDSAFIVDDDGYIFANKTIHTCGGDIYLPTNDAVIIDLSLSNSPALDLSGCSTNCAIDFAGGVEGTTYWLTIHQHPTSAVTATWGEDIMFSGGAPPTITATADAYDSISIGYRFGKYWASWIGDFKRTS